MNKKKLNLYGKSTHSRSSQDILEVQATQPAPDLKTDWREVQKTLNVYQSGNAILEVRILANQRSSQIHSMIMTNNSEGFSALRNALKAERLDDVPLYMTLNSIRTDADVVRNVNKLHASGKTTADRHMSRYRFVHLDFDPVRESGTQATEDGVHAAQQLCEQLQEILAGFGFPTPIVAFSGNGYNLDYPADFEASKENAKRVNKFLHVLSERFSTPDVEIDVSTSNPARIIKLFGCPSKKGENSADRPYRMTKILSVPEQQQSVVSLSDIDDIINKLSHPSITNVNSNGKQSRNNSSQKNTAKLLDVASWLDSYHIEHRDQDDVFNGELTKKFELACCPFNEHDNHYCSALFQFPNGNVIFNCFHNHCKDYTIYDMLDKFPLTNQIPLLNSEMPTALIYNEIVKDVQFVYDSNKIKYLLDKDHRLMQLDSEEADEMIAVKAHDLDIIPSSGMIDTVKRNIKSLYSSYAKYAEISTRIALCGSHWYYALSREKIVSVVNGSVSLKSPNDISEVMFEYPESFNVQCDPDLSVKPPELPTLVMQAFNISSEYRECFLAELLSFYLPHIPTPILLLSGGQGTGKSTTCRKIAQLVDPTTVDVQSIPMKEDALIAALSNNYLNCFDNCSKLSSALNDMMCMAVTGATISRRKLYTNNSQLQLRLNSKIVINGIGDLITRSDTGERCNPIYLEPILSSMRVSERRVWCKFNELKPKIIGGVFNTIAETLQRIHEDLPDNLQLPRMADFAEYSFVAMKVMGLDPNYFLQKYCEHTNQLIGEQTETDSFVIILRSFLTNHDNNWEGTAAGLLRSLTNHAITIRMNLNTFTAATLSRFLNQMSTNYETIGIHIEWHHGKQRIIRISQDTDFILQNDWNSLEKRRIIEEMMEDEGETL